MSTLRVSNIEAKADPSSPTINEKVKITNSNGDVMLQLDGATPGITTVGINTTTAAFTVDANQNIEFVGSVKSSGVSTFSSGLNVTGGNIGIRTTSPTRPLTVAAGSGESVNILGVFDTRFANPATVGNSVIAFSDPTSTAGQFSTRLGSVGDSLAFYTNGSNERMRITSTGNVQITNGNLVFSTSGTGIDFSATANGSGTTNSELFDDYEEGTFTLTCSASGGTTITSYGASGRYTKVGRMVHVHIIITISNSGTANGQYLNFAGLPFTSANTFNCPGVAREQSINGYLSTAQITGNATSGALFRWDNSGVIVNGGNWQMSIVYEAQ